MAEKPFAVLLFSRLPALGRVKTRLLPRFSEEESLALHRALLSDSLDLIRRVAETTGASTWLYLSEEGPLDSEISSHLDTCPVLTQRGADLGERLLHAFQERFEAGAEKVVVIGSDSPHIPSAVIARAIDELASHEVALGPARDGGYYLLGLARLHASLLAGMPWGSSHVYRETVRRARREGLSLASLPAFSDVDVPESVAALWDDLSKRGSEAGPEMPESCYRLLREWAQQGKL